jgi:hypothetical protein
MTSDTPDRWQLRHKFRSDPIPFGIEWDVVQDTRLPHSDHVEMSGRKVSVIVRYGVDAQRNLTLSREIIWPTLRIQPNDVRGYLKQTYGDDFLPRIEINGQPVGPLSVERVVLHGNLSIGGRWEQGLYAQCTLLPSQDQYCVIEEWSLTNVSPGPLEVNIHPLSRLDEVEGMYGRYVCDVKLDKSKSVLLHSRQFITRRKREVDFTITYSAGITASSTQTISMPRFSTDQERDKRFDLQYDTDVSLHLDTPDPVLNHAFAFAKQRATESVFETKRGLMHSPGGGRYYAGIWANDQAEYANPLFPFLNHKPANEAALNAYRIFASAMTPDYAPIPSSFEMEGDIQFHAGGDRGDAAMVAYGAARFALARGSKTIGRELWPLVEWCLEYCRRKTNADGVVESDTDELEGRFPTGTANLSTSSLAYGGLRAGANLARALGKPARVVDTYTQRADELALAIERYFGANVEGYETYRYYDGNTTLRAWICLPLTMGLFARSEGTIAALFSPRLWTPDGLATEAGDKVFWDRATLYALRGVFAAGATDTALQRLTAYSRRRLLGEHVPYPVEAYPEGGQAHLAAESALYCRIFTEGLFGITPTGFRSFTCRPYLPAAWERMSLRDIRAFGQRFDLVVTRREDTLLLAVEHKGQTFHEIVLPGKEDGGVEITLA